MRNFKETFPFTLLLGIFHITFCSYKGHYAEIFACNIYIFWTMFLKIKWERSIKIKKVLFKAPELLMCVASDQQSCSY